MILFLLTTSYLTEGEVLILRKRVVLCKHLTVGQGKVLETQAGKC